MSAITPDLERLQTFLAAADDDVPIVMINLLRFREQASYEPGSGAEPCTGREAYARYGEVAIQKIQDVGGRLLWHGRVASTLIAAKGEEWDEAALVEYPSCKAFAQMLSQPEYQRAAIHRTAALSDSRLIATTTAASTLQA